MNIYTNPKFDLKYYTKLRVNHCKQSNPNSRDYLDSDKDSLQDLSHYLDQAGYKMPLPKWKYNPDDITTWVYVQNKGRIEYNTLFKYRDT